MTRKTRLIVAVAMVMSLATGAMAASIADHDRLFTDVPESHTHVNAIHWAAENGIIYGYQGQDGTFESGNTFGPSDFITRGQTASILKRYHDAFPPGNGQDGEDGDDGKDGKNGTDGKDGQDGADGRDGVAGLEVVGIEKTLKAGEKNVRFDQACPEGKLVVGGGFDVENGPEVVVHTSAPQVNLTQTDGVWNASGWTVIATNPSNKNAQVQPFAICADISN